MLYRYVSNNTYSLEEKNEINHCSGIKQDNTYWLTLNTRMRKAQINIVELGSSETIHHIQTSEIMRTGYGQVEVDYIH